MQRFADTLDFIKGLCAFADTLVLHFTGSEESMNLREVQDDLHK